MSMWQQTEELAKQHGDGQWLRLQHDGDRAVVVVLGEPYPREVAFIDGRFVLCTEAMKAQGTKASLRVAFNVALYDERIVKVFEQGVTFFKDLVQARSRYGLDKWAFEIRRNGAAKDLKTTYSIIPERQLTPEEQEEFSKLPLLDLAKIYAEGDGQRGAPRRAHGQHSAGDDFPPTDDDDIPF